MGWTDLIERLKQATGLSDRQVAAMEKRRAFRVSRRVGLIGVRENGEKIRMLSINFGAQGMRLESPRRLQKDEVLRLAVTADERRQDIDVDDDAPRARVVWARKRKDMPTCEVGLLFVLETPEQRRAAAHFLLDDCRLGIRDPREHRKTPRVKTQMSGLLQTDDGTTSEVSVKDIAMSGALVVSPRPIERNTALGLKVFLPGTDQALVCRGSVARNLQVGAREWELGIAFTEVAEDHQERLVACLSRLLSEEAM